MYPGTAEGPATLGRFRLRDAGPTLRLFLTTFVLVLTIGYATGLFLVEHTTSMSSRGVAEEFRGSPEENPTQAMKFAKSPRQMFILIHDHVLSLSLVFFALGGIFYFSTMVPEGIKKFLLVEPLVAIVTTFGGIGLVRYVSDGFTWLVIISGVSLFCCYAAMVALILIELWRPSANGGDLQIRR